MDGNYSLAADKIIVSFRPIGRELLKPKFSVVDRKLAILKALTA